MNIWMVLEEKKKFTVSEKAVADYLFLWADRLESLETKQICSDCYISHATLYRLFAKLGCSGWPEFKKRLQMERQAYCQGKSVLDFNFPFLSDSNLEEIADHLAKDLTTTIYAARMLFDPETMKQIVASMHGAEKIGLFTSAGNVALARNFQFQMMEIGRQVLLPVDEYEQHLLAAQMDEKDFFILITVGGRGMANQEIANVLGANQVPGVLISSSTLLPGQRHARWQLLLPSIEDHSSKISSFSTRQSLLYTLDLLYSCFFQIEYEKNIRFKLDTYQKMVSGGSASASSGKSGAKKPKTDAFAKTAESRKD